MYFLNSNQKKDTLKSIEELYGTSEGFEGHLIMSEKEKLYLVSDSEFIRSGEDKNLRVDRTGIQIGTTSLSGIRLSIEGSQLLGPNATKNVLELSDEQVDLYITGRDLVLTDDQKELVGEKSALYIIRNGNDFFGSAVAKNGFLQNAFPKIRRLKNINR